jgi:hypothetical protein
MVGKMGGGAGLPCVDLSVLSDGAAKDILVILVLGLRDPLVAVHQPHNVRLVRHLLHNQACWRIGIVATGSGSGST